MEMEFIAFVILFVLRIVIPVGLLFVLGALVAAPRRASVGLARPAVAEAHSVARRPLYGPDTS